MKWFSFVNVGLMSDTQTHKRYTFWSVKDMLALRPWNSSFRSHEDSLWASLAVNTIVTDWTGQSWYENIMSPKLVFSWEHYVVEGPRSLLKLHGSFATSMSTLWLQQFSSVVNCYSAHHLSWTMVIFSSGCRYASIIMTLGNSPLIVPAEIFLLLVHGRSLGVDTVCFCKYSTWLFCDILLEWWPWGHG